MSHYRLIIDLPDYVNEEEAREAASEISEAGVWELESGEDVDIDSVQVEKVDD